MGKYLKMADAFGSDIVINGFFIGCHVDGEYCELAECESMAYSQYIYHAINSHDGLVAEVERLRGEIDILNCRLEKHMERMIDRLHK